MKNFRKVLSMLLAVVITLSAAFSAGTVGFKAAAADTLAAENELHEKNLSSINSKYDRDISSNERNAENIMSIYGVSSLSSKSYYQSRLADVESKIQSTSSLLSYYQRDSMGGHTAEINRLSSDLSNLYSLSAEYTKLCEACDYMDKANKLQSEKQNEINAENRRHEQAVQNIKNNQPQDEETKPDTDKPSTDKPVKPQNTNSPLQNLINAFLYKFQLDVSLVYLGVQFVVTVIGIIRK